MCNDYEQHVTHADYVRAMKAADLPPPDAPAQALLAADDIKIGDLGPVLVAVGNGAELRPMKFGWAPPRKGAGPVFNFKSDGRHFDKSKRCVVVLSGFFEFTGSKYPKAKHRLSLKGSPVMGIAGLYHEAEGDEPESFTMLTTAPGPDIEPYHDRQVCVLRPEEWAAWLFLTKPEAELLRPLPAGTLEVKTVRPEFVLMPAISAGILLHRGRPGGLEVFLVHPGGPFWAKKDAAAWSIPKGGVNPGEDLEAAARREFAEEVGVVPAGSLQPLGEFRQSAAKTVVVFALEGDFDPAALVSNTIEIEWPTRSGRRLEIPEVDRAAWFDLQIAEGKLHKGQVPMIDALKRLLQTEPLTGKGV